MPRRYINITEKVTEKLNMKLNSDFIQSRDPNKIIVVRKVRLINPYGQLDVGCCLCGDFADESSYSVGLMDDFIMCTNELNQKEIHIHNNNCNHISFWFRDYKGELLKSDDNYYFTLEIELIF